MRDATSDKEAPVSFERKLKLAGMSYMLGDAAMIGAGTVRKFKDPVTGELKREGFYKSALSASIWMAGGIVAALFGNPDKEMQLRIQASRLERHLQKQGVTIPEDVRARAELFKDRGLWEKTQEFLYEHPSEILNGSYAVGAANLIRGGVEQVFSKKTHGLLPGNGKLPMANDLWIGGLILAGALIGLCVKEDKGAVKKAEGKGPMEKAIAFVAEKPLRVTAGFYGVNNLFLASKAWQDFNQRALYQGEAMKAHYFSGTQLGCYLFSNLMLFLSPREQINHNSFNPSDIAKLEDAAAALIANQPKEAQDSIIKSMSAFMSEQLGGAHSAETIATELRQRLQPKTTLSPTESRHVERIAARENARRGAAGDGTLRLRR